MIYLVELLDKDNRSKIPYIEDVYSNMNEKEEGVLDLFWELESNGKCETYSKIRALYVAYLLEKNRINTNIKLKYIKN